jgi:PAS domain S-box-containing protein
LERETREKAEAQAAWLAALPETRRYLDTGIRDRSFFEAICEQRDLGEVFIERAGGRRLPVCSPPAPEEAPEAESVVVRTELPAAGESWAALVLAARIPVDLAAKQREIRRHISEYDQLTANRKATRTTYLLLLALITLFILFVATWIALFLARQISVPISALLQASEQVRGGNLGYRIRVQAIDELAGLVRSFNEMTRDLETNARELESRRRFIEAILENIPTGVVSVSSDGEIQMVNRALARIFPSEQVKGATRVEHLFPPDDAAEIRYLMNRARRTGVASRQFDFKRDQQSLHLSVTVSALEDKANSGFVVVIEDTGDMLRAQKTAAWREVARRIAHELKNPLTPITLSAQRIVRQVERAARAEGAPSREVTQILRECAGTISQEVESVKTLVDEFSQFARFPAAQPSPADLNEVVESALSVFAGRLDGIELEKDLEEGLPAVSIDREQFKRVVVNLVDNSAEAMLESLTKRLYVGTRAAGTDGVELVVADTGCGISVEDKEKLFLPYFSTKGRGTGLGLAIVNHILSEHGAQIRVEDNHPAGVRFIVEIPALAAWAPDAKSLGGSA